MKKLLTFLTLLTLFFGVGWAEESLFYKLDGTITGGTNGYATVSDITQGSMTWKVTGNTTTNPWRIGGKEISQVDRPVYSTTAMGNAISKVSVELGTGEITIVQVQLIVASDAQFNNSIQTQSKTASFNSTIEFTPAEGEWPNGAYYKLNFLVTNTGKSNKYLELKAVNFYKNEGGSTTETCATPTFSPAAGTYTEPQSVTLSCTTPGSTIYYTTDGSNPTTSSTEYTSAITVSETTTIKAIATADGMDPSPVASATYTFPTILTNLAAVNALTDGSSFTFNAQTVVLGKYNKQLYIVMPNNSAGTLVFGNSNWSNDYTYGKVVSSGWSGSKTTYNDKPEVEDPSNFTLNGTEAEVTPIEISSDADLTKANFGRYAVIRNVQVAADGSFSELTTYDQFHLSFTDFEAGRYDVYGVIGWNNGVGQFMPLQYEEHVAAYTITVNQPAAGGSISADAETADEGDVVTLTATPATGYEFTSWTVKDANNNDVDVSTDNKFTMPASNVTVTATFSKVGDLYVMGNVNGIDVNGWHANQGVKMDFINGAYTADIWVTGKWNDEMQKNAGSFAFTKVLANNGSGEGAWGWVNGYGHRIQPSADGKYYWLNSGSVSNIPLYVRGDNDGEKEFLIPAGLYTITVTPADPSVQNDTWKFSFVEKNLTPTITPNGGDVALNSTATVALSEDFNEFIANCPKVLECTPGNGSDVYTELSLTLPEVKLVLNGNVAEGTTTDYEFDTAGSVTLTGEGKLMLSGSEITSATKTATATFNVTEVDMSNVYTLVESANDLVAGGEYLIVGSTNDAPYSAILGAMAGSGSTYANAIKENFTYDATAKTITLNEGCTATPLILGGESGAWTFNNGSGYIAYTSSTTSTSGTNNLWLLSDVSANGTTWNIQTDKLPSDNELIQNNFNSKRHIRYNSQGTRFAGYGSGQSAVALFKKATATTPKSEAPVITPEGGNVVGYSQEVEITQANGGIIYYTTDGTTPTEDPTHQYNGKFWAEGENLGDEVTITAVAKEEGKELSTPVSVTYKFIAPAAPTFSPQGGTYTSYQYVELATATESADVYYTTDGSNPSVNNGTKYTEPIAVTENVTIKAITVYHDAHVNKDATSGSRQAKYTIVTDGIVEVENIAEFNAIQPDENNEYPEVRFKNPVTVLYDYSQRSYSSQLQLTTYQEYIWVKDESGFTQIFLRPSLNNNNDEDHQIAFYENGDVIPGGFVVRKQYYETGEYYQAYSDKAGDDPTKPGNNVAAGFAGATQKALADPEPMTAAQLATLTTSDENIANYNNRYIRISKIKVTNIDGKNFDFEDEQGKGRNIAGYNKYSDATSYIKGGETLVTETINFPQTASNTTYYDVTAILCTWQNGWEIMPISFTPWQANELTLRELCKDGVTTEGENEYTISNNLMCVFAKDNSIWVKDDTGQSIWPATPTDGDLNFEVYAEAADGVPANTRLEQAYYDQSNWCEIKLADGVDASQFEGQIIKGGSIHGNFTNKLNPTLENVTLTSAAISSEGDYAPNYYMPVNFTGRYACSNNGHNDFESYYFFMTPKPQEYAQIVWAVWDHESKKFIMSTSDNDNGHRFEGEFSIDLSLNTGVKATGELQPGYGYNFTAIIRMVETTSSNAPSLKRQGDIQNDQSANYIVYPLNLDEGQNPVTAINTIDVNGKAIKSVKYVNVAGVVSDKPFSGVNIVVTEYTDGSRSTTKMLRK